MADVGGFCYSFIRSLHSYSANPRSSICLDRGRPSFSVDAISHSDYYKEMSNVTSQNDKLWVGLKGCGRDLAYWPLAACPLCSIVLFFEITRPAHIYRSGPISTELSSAASGNASWASLPL